MSLGISHPMNHDILKKIHSSIDYPFTNIIHNRLSWKKSWLIIYLPPILTPLKTHNYQRHITKVLVGKSQIKREHTKEKIANSEIDKMGVGTYMFRCSEIFFL